MKRSLLFCAGFAAAVLLAVGAWFALRRAPLAPSAVTLSAGPFVAGQPSELSFVVADAAGAPVSDLAISHERSMHVVIVDDGFRTFSHVHPEDAGPVSAEQLASGALAVRHVFPSAGKYLIAVDYARGGQAFSSTFARSATGAPFRQPAVFADLSRVARHDDLTIRLDAPKAIRAGETVALSFAFEKDGVLIDDLEPYLGAGAHLSVVREDLGQFVHAHGMPASMAEHLHMGHEMRLPAALSAPLVSEVAFPTAGRYRLFAEYRRGGQVSLARFAVDVGE